MSISAILPDDMVRIAVRVQPRARKDEIAGERQGALVVRVTAPPVEGRANDAVRRLIAKRLGIAAGRVSVVRGATGRDKLVEIEGMEADAVRRALSISGPADRR
jgi:uncharacterized protein (TIGR00251 family)